MKFASFKPVLLAALILCLSSVGSVRLLGQDRPSAPKLLPDKTLLYLRINDSRELVEAFQATSFGKLGQDEQIKPLVSQLYSSAAEAFGVIEEELGVSLTQILEVPQGEVCIAVVGGDLPEPAFIAFVEVGENVTVDKLLERAELEMKKEGATRSTEMVGDTEVITLRQAGDDEVSFFRRQGVVVVSNSDLALQGILTVWDGGDSRTLADNRKFTTIMRRSAGTKDERPQISFYVDPIEFVRTVSRGNFAAQAGLAILPRLGVDGLKAVGGSVIMATADFDSIMHIHIMLENPREGVMRALALKTGDMTPEQWAPVDAASYMTLYLDLEEAYDVAADMFERFVPGDRTLGDVIDRRVGSQIDVDVEGELIRQLAGRFTYVTWFEKPARVNSQTNLIGIRVKDTGAVKRTLDKLAAGRFSEQISTKSHRGTTYYSVDAGGRNGPRGQDVPNELLRQPTPCFGILGDYLLFSDSVKCFEKAIASKNDSSKSLATELDFKLIATNITRHTGETEPSMITFERPEESLRSFYELATDQSVRGRLSSAAEANQFFKVLDQALKDNPLPPFSVIAQYLAPTGGMIVSDETGIHYTAFSLKRDKE